MTSRCGSLRLSRLLGHSARSPVSSSYADVRYIDDVIAIEGQAAGPIQVRAHLVLTFTRVVAVLRV